MRTNKTRLLGGVALSALALGLMASPASAFDEVNWEWNAKIHEYTKINVDVDVYNDPTGLVQIEKLQMQIGDVNAESYVSDIHNYQPEGSGSTTVDLGNLSFTGSYNKYTGAVSGTASGPEIDGEKFLSGTVNTDHPYGVTMNFDLGTVTVDAQGNSLDALTELPEVVSSATAVGNNQNIESEVAVLLHDGQFVFGGFGYGYHNDIDLPYYGPLSDNTNLALLGGLLQAGADGVIKPAEITATSKVWDIKNASVDSSATAVGNNINVAVATTTADNQVVIGDITQFAYADLSAKSSVHDVTLQNYTNLGVLGRPIVNSVATAVGNNVNIKVGAPAPAAP